MTQHQRLKELGASKSSIMKAASDYAKSVGLKPGAALEDLVHALGGKIRYLGFSNATSHDHESIIIKNTNDFEIFLPPHTSMARDRFTIAHELGHYLLQYKKGMGVRAAGRSPGPSNERVEWEANWFAAGLLMPEDVFREKLTSSNHDIEELAKYFGVSRKAVEIRAKDLNEF